MGGRGANSWLDDSIRFTGLDVTGKDGETVRYYFTKNEGTNYYQRGYDGMPRPTPLNISAKEFKRRAESNGATTKPVTKKQYFDSKKAHKAYRKEMDKFLNLMWYKAGPRPHKGWEGH